MNPFYLMVSLTADHRCEYCHAPELVFNFPFEVEHIIPLKQGGIDAEYNLALACRSCNLHKGAKIVGVEPNSGIERPLFNPRQDQWHSHFQVEMKTGMIIGKTLTGKVTIALLQMNSTPQIAARKLWIQLDLFPYQGINS